MRGRKKTIGTKPTVQRSFAIPMDELGEWDKFKTNCENLGISMSSLLRSKIKQINQEIEKESNKIAIENVED